MNANSIFAPDLRLVLAHARTYERLAEAAVEAQRSRTAPSTSRIAAAFRRLRDAVTTMADTRTSTLPSLDGYPYRS